VWRSCSGSFAIVKLAVRKSDGKQFAIKIIKKTKLNAEELAVVHDEAEIMQRVRSSLQLQLDVMDLLSSAYPSAVCVLYRALWDWSVLSLCAPSD